jgi:hypothetical protein
METFLEWLRQNDLLARLRLIETYFSFDPAQYNKLFDDELAKLSVSSPEHREALERMRGFNWVGYIAASLRHAGWQDQREVQERTHDIVVKLLMGKLFSGFSQETSGFFDLRYKRSVANAVKNLAEKERNRRRFIPTVSIGNEFRPGAVTADDLPAPASSGQQDDKLIQDFRRLVRTRIGELGIAVLDARLQGQETKALVGRPDLGSPGRYVIKRTVQEIKALAREYASGIGDAAFLRDIERAMGREETTVEKRRAATAGKQVTSP